MPKTYYPTLEDDADDAERPLAVWLVLTAAGGAALLVALTLSGAQSPPSRGKDIDAGSPHHVGEVRFHRHR